ncbi:hypothetical protein [Natronomonas sp.]|uniref:hypothetical protein n=1 Tax=Natronomonas sp. TaxID=2184060 RepID=UPI003976853D
MASVDVEYCAACRLVGTAIETRRVLADRLCEYDEIAGVRVEPAQENVPRVSVEGDRT